jgi:hypothetical protein
MNRVAFILDQFELQSPGQQLLDRFLIGYKHNGEFKSAPAKVVISLPKADQISLVQSRVKDFGLEVADSLKRAVTSADAVLLAPGTRKSQEPAAIRLEQALAALTPNTKVFIDGALLLTEATINQRQSPIIVSRAASHLFPLPISPSLRGTNVQRALIVVQGSFPDAELDAFYAVKPYLANSWTQSAAPTIQHLQDAKLWDFAYSSDWRPLLGAAISRSNNIKGDPDKDGRTQDIVGLQLIEKLAPKARGWRLQHTSGMQMLILVCDGALADFNLALEANGRIHSAQLYHGQPPMENHYDEMAAWIINQFTRPTPASNLPEALFINDILRAMKPLAPSG